MSRTQTLVQLNRDLLARLDERAAREGRTRSALIREATERYLADDIAADNDRRIVAGYRREPQTADADAWARGNALRAIADEPW